MEKLSTVNGLVINQRKEWGEILTGFETKNRYIISDISGNSLYLAGEETGSVLLRWFLKGMRPFTVTVLSEDGLVAFRVKRPFRFYFHRVEVVDSQGQLLGVLERRFSILRRIYSVLDSSGREVSQLFGPILHPWTFQIRNGEIQYGKIIKRWSGLLKESVTEADNFSVMFPTEWDVKLKALFIGAVFLIDFVHFEKNR